MINDHLYHPSNTLFFHGKYLGNKGEEKCRRAVIRDIISAISVGKDGLKPLLIKSAPWRRCVALIKKCINGRNRARHLMIYVYARFHFGGPHAREFHPSRVLKGRLTGRDRL